MRCHAAQALWRIDGQVEPILPVLIAALSDTSRSIRMGVLTTLAQMGDKARPAVTARNALALNEADPEVRLLAAQLLWRLDPNKSADVAKGLGKILETNDSALQKHGRPWLWERWEPRQPKPCPLDSGAAKFGCDSRSLRGRGDRAYWQGRGANAGTGVGR